MQNRGLLTERDLAAIELDTRWQDGLDRVTGMGDIGVLEID